MSAKNNGQFDHEQEFRSEIVPLVQQVVDLCDLRKVHVVAVFQYADTEETSGVGAFVHIHGGSQNVAGLLKVIGGIASGKISTAAMGLITSVVQLDMLTNGPDDKGWLAEAGGEVEKVERAE